MGIFHSKRTRDPVRRALLVGIAKVGPEKNQTEGGLLGPHKGVDDMKDLLKKVYGYRDSDIVTVVDTNDLDERQPTRADLLTEVRRLVDGAQAGDIFVFYFAGHGLQVRPTSRKGTKDSEEDGVDEAIRTVDGEVITDDELRACLVPSLPAGCSLVAIFDCCHSVSLLDLPHYRCNQVYFPWESKGTRRTLEKWKQSRRQGGMLASVRSQRLTQDENHAETRGRRMSLTCGDVSAMTEVETISQNIENLTGKKAPKPTSVADGTSGCNIVYPMKRCLSPVARFCEGWCRRTAK